MREKVLKTRIYVNNGRTMNKICCHCFEDVNQYCESWAVQLICWTIFNVLSLKIVLKWSLTSNHFPWHCFLSANCDLFCRNFHRIQWTKRKRIKIFRDLSTNCHYCAFCYFEKKLSLPLLFHLSVFYTHTIKNYVNVARDNFLRSTSSTQCLSFCCNSNVRPSYGWAVQCLSRMKATRRDVARHNYNYTRSSYEYILCANHYLPFVLKMVLKLECARLQQPNDALCFLWSHQRRQRFIGNAKGEN